MKLHLFNPGYEVAVMQEKTVYTPAKNVARMTYDLAALPLWYATSGDEYAWTNDDTHLLFEQLPKGITPNGKPISCLNGAADCVPWGLSPDSLANFNRLKAKSGLNLNVPTWNSKYKELTSRKTAAIASAMMRDGGLEVPFVAEFFSSLEELESHLSGINCDVIVKTPFSSSGRGLLKVSAGGLSNNERKWIAGAIKKQGAVSVEKFLAKTLDFAFEYDSNGDSITFEGVSLFENNMLGSYGGNRLLPQEKAEQLIKEQIGENLFSKLIEEHINVLKKLYAPYYKGYIGVDMMLYKKDDDSIGVCPCVEINMRNTMGMVAINLYKYYIYHPSEGFYSVEYFASPIDAMKFHLEMTNKMPTVVENGRLRSGYMCLTPVGEQTQYLAYVVVY